VNFYYCRLSCINLAMGTVACGIKGSWDLDGVIYVGFQLCIGLYDSYFCL